MNTGVQNKNTRLHVVLVIHSSLMGMLRLGMCDDPGTAPPEMKRGVLPRNRAAYQLVAFEDGKDPTDILCDRSQGSVKCRATLVSTDRTSPWQSAIILLI
jgi:hypothetical protein